VIIHSEVESLIKSFLELKKVQGTEKEKKIYAHLNVEDFVVRALTKRPLTFFGSNDITFLREDFDMPLPSDWNRVGTDAEGAIKIEDYMTYDEIVISALIGVSVPSFFINKGGRNNVGQAEDEKEDYGIYVALTGARFEKKEKMESQHMLVTESTDAAHGYGANADKESRQYKLLDVWAKFYNMKLNEKDFGFPSWDEVDSVMKAYKQHEDDPSSTTELPPKPIWFPHFVSYQQNAYTPQVYINHYIYKKRIRLIIEPFLWEANRRAQEEGKKAYLHAIGLGLGVWQISPKQADWMLEVYRDILTEGDFSDIDIVDFSWFPSDLPIARDFREVQKNGHTIQIKYSKRDPAEKLQPEGKYLLVAMYAWDGNSYPGNEYWRGMLHASGDPAAACCSTITELQNPEINMDFVRRIEWYPTQSKL